MKITSAELKGAYRSHIRKQVPPSREGCPSPENILNVFDSSTSSADKERIVNHLAGCSYCFQEFELCLGFLREQGRTLEDIAGWLKIKDKKAKPQPKRAQILEAVLGPRIHNRPIWNLALGLLFAAAVTGLIFYGLKSLVRAPEFKERGKLPGQIQLLSPVRGNKAKFPLVFQWEETPSVEYYCLEIFDSTLLPLWKSPRIERLRYELPPEAAEFIREGQTYFWTITAWLKDGTKRESPLEEFIFEK
jgi:hypothetical protein